MRPSDWKRGRRSCSKKCSIKIKNIHRGEEHCNWKGNLVGYTGIHSWIKRRLPTPKRCQSCNKKKHLDLANISNQYKRDLNDWEYLCRKCHMLKDGRLEKLTHNHFKSLECRK